MKYVFKKLERYMKKHYIAGIVKSKENGVTVIQILGLENKPKEYKHAYQHVLEEIKKNQFRMISLGEPDPVIRTHPSLEIH